MEYLGVPKSVYITIVKQFPHLRALADNIPVIGVSAERCFAQNACNLALKIPAVDIWRLGKVANGGKWE